MTCSCKPPRVWASYRGPDQKPIIVNLKPNESLPVAGRVFCIHLGPLVMVEAVLDQGGVGVALRQVEVEGVG